MQPSIIPSRSVVLRPFWTTGLAASLWLDGEHTPAGASAVATLCDHHGQGRCKKHIHFPHTSLHLEKNTAKGQACEDSQTPNWGSKSEQHQGESR